MSGPPAPVKAILKQFSSGREEDKMSGYLNFLKVGPKLLKWLPGKKASDLRTWLTVYGYWSEGALDNVVSMLTIIINEFDLNKDQDIAQGQSEEKGKESAGGSKTQSVRIPLPVRALIEHPQQGLYHPDLGSRNQKYLESTELSASEYMTSPKEVPVLLCQIVIIIVHFNTAFRLLALWV